MSNVKKLINLSFSYLTLIWHLSLDICHFLTFYLYIIYGKIVAYYKEIHPG